MNNENNAGRPHATMPISADSGLKLYRAAPDLMVEVRKYIERASEESGYGYSRPANPHDFFPDAECCSAEEIAAHKAACEAYDKGEYTPERRIECAGNMHILSAPWGIGGYTYRDEEGAALLARLDALAATPAQPIAPPTELTAELRRWAGDVDNYASIMFRKAADEIERLTATAPTDISAELRRLAGDDTGYDSTLMRSAADECERFYGGMIAWKETAQQKDRILHANYTHNSKISQPIAPAADVSAPTDERAALEIAVSALERLARTPGCGCSFPCQCNGDEWTRAELEGRMGVAESALTKIEAARAAAPVSGHGASIGMWLQSVDEDGYRTDDERTAARILLKIAPTVKLAPAGSLADDEVFKLLLGSYYLSDEDTEAMRYERAICAYIDSRPRSEDSRAKVLQECADLIATVSCQMPTGWDSVYRSVFNQGADNLRMAGAAAIRALASSAAPTGASK